MTTPPDSEELRERIVEDILQQLRTYGRRYRPQAAELYVDVKGAASLGKDDRHYVRMQVGRFTRNEGWLSRADVRFLAVENLCRDEFRVSLDEVPTRREGQPPAPSILVAMFILTWRRTAADEVELPLLVTIGEAPVLLLRPEPGDHETIYADPTPLLLNGFPSIPSGGLLQLVRLAGAAPDGQSDGFGLQRTATRADDVHVTLDGRLLTPGGPARPLKSKNGTIVFRRSGSHGETLLDYRLGSPNAPRQVTRPFSGSGTRMQIEFLGGGERVTADVEPPPISQPIKKSGFPVGDLRTVEAHVLHTRAKTVESTGQSPAEWHVKLYSCGSAGEARALRSYLLKQADVIDTVNREAGDGRFGEVVAPVYVLLPSAAAVELDTNLGGPPAMDVPEDSPASRLADWFGADELPHADCYVVVASPWLTPVVWTPRHLMPNLRGIGDVRPIAAALQLCHVRDVLHGDVKPDNVCWSSGHYVLVDGDAITPTRAVRTGAIMRRSRFYTSRAVREYLSRQEPAQFDICEHDRFGFAIVTVAAVAGHNAVLALLQDRGDNERLADSREGALNALDAILESGWQPLKAALAGAFDDQALQRWSSPMEWLDSVDAAGAKGRGEVPVIDDPHVPPLEPGTYPFAEQVRACARNRAKDKNLFPEAIPKDAVLPCLTTNLNERAASAHRSAFTTWCLIIIGPALLLLLFVILGR
ncbi:MAG: hypothetical protein AB7L91_18110 [Dehalococcoidia bacterium]